MAKEKRMKRISSLKIAAVAVVSALVIFAVLIVIENRFINHRITKPVVVVTNELPEGIVITEKNVGEFFGLQQRAVDEVPSCTLYSGVSQLYGQITSRMLYKNEIVTESCFVSADFYNDIEEPVEISIHVKDIGRVVGGIIRPGDKIDITAVFKGNGATVLGSPLDEDVIASGYGIKGDYVLQSLAKGVRVKNVYNSSGESSSSVDVNGGLMIGTIINVIVPRSMQGMIYTAMEEGTIYMSKVIDTIDVIEGE